MDGRYSNQALLTSFVSTFPAEAPEYVVYVLLDEPQRLAETNGYATAGVNVAPTTKRIIERIGPMLGVAPKLGHRDPARQLTNFAVLPINGTDHYIVIR